MLACHGMQAGSELGHAVLWVLLGMRVLQACMPRVWHWQPEQLSGQDGRAVCAGMLCVPVMTSWNRYKLRSMRSTKPLMSPIP